MGDGPNDGTTVELDELTALSGSFLGAAAAINATAEKAVNTHYHSNMFGALAWLVADEATATAQRTGQGLFSLSSNVEADARNVAASATEFDNTEQTQTARFRSTHG